MADYLSIKFNRPVELIALAVEAMIEGKACTLVISENEFTDGLNAPDFVSKSIVECGVWVKKSKFSSAKVV